MLFTMVHPGVSVQAWASTVKSKASQSSGQHLDQTIGFPLSRRFSFLCRRTIPFWHYPKLRAEHWWESAAAQQPIVALI